MSAARNHPSSSPSSSPSKLPQPIIASSPFKFSADPQFVEAVNAVANLKIQAAIKSGHLRVARPAPKAYTPRLDIMDDPASSVVTAILEIPGVPEEDIQIKILNSSVTVHGTRKHKRIAAATRRLCHRGKDISSFPLRMPVETQINMGPFYRQFTIPDGIEASEVTATLWNGLLLVSWPRVPRSSHSNTNDGSDHPIGATEDT